MSFLGNPAVTGAILEKYGIRAQKKYGQNFLIDENILEKVMPDDLMKFVLNLRDRGYTILMIEHDMQMVMNISDRIYVMNYGKVIANGTPKDIVSNKEVIHAYLGESEDDE